MKPTFNKFGQFLSKFYLLNVFVVQLEKSSSYQHYRHQLFAHVALILTANARFIKRLAIFDSEYHNSSSNYVSIKAILPTVFSIMGKFYAVARGRQVGIYMNWNDCKAQVDGFPNARFKKFGSQLEAEHFVRDNRDNGGAEGSQSLKLHLADAGSTFHKTVSSRLSHIHVPKASYTFSIPPSPQYQFPAPSRLQQTRTTILIDPRSRPGSILSNAVDTSRGISTSSKLDKRSLRVTDDRVTGTKRLKTEANLGVDLSNFQVDEEGYVVVFTDGACTKNGRRGAKAGIGVWFGDGHNLNISEPVLGRQTNNTAEIQAAERAIIQAKNAGITKLKLNTDSQFTINCVTMWLNKWKRNNWKLATGQDVKNREDLEKLDQAIIGIEIKWAYVQGHKGHYGNEQADKLAITGANMSR